MRLTRPFLLGPPSPSSVPWAVPTRHPKSRCPRLGPPPVVANAEPAPAEASSAEKDDAEAMRRLLNGPVAYFEFDKADLTSEDQQKLQLLAEELKAHPTAHIVIAGNTDEVGTEAYNLALGQRAPRWPAPNSSRWASRLRAWTR